MASALPTSCARTAAEEEALTKEQLEEVMEIRSRAVASMTTEQLKALLDTIGGAGPVEHQSRQQAIGLL